MTTMIKCDALAFEHWPSLFEQVFSAVYKKMKKKKRVTFVGVEEDLMGHALKSKCNPLLVSRKEQQNT